MEVFSRLQQYEHEQVVFCQNKEAGLKAIIAVHNTTLGPSLGGARMWQYVNDETALTDALRLSRGMTYKASVAGLNLGGGKAVILGDHKTQKSEYLFRAFGKFVHSLAGKYITAEDVGTTVRDMEYVRMETPFVTGISESLGGSGDPSPVTAYGVYVGMKACAKAKWGGDSLAGKRVMVQGLGKVAGHLCGHLYDEGAVLLVSDIDQKRIDAVLRHITAEVIEPDNVYSAQCDIFSPNALGAVCNDETIPRFTAEIIAGGANNQLADEAKHGLLLKQRGILFAPDYVINAGGLINVAYELEGYSRDKALKHAESIYENLLRVFALAESSNIPTYEASNLMAEERIRKMAGINSIYAGDSRFSGRYTHLFRK